MADETRISKILGPSGYIFCLIKDSLNDEKNDDSGNAHPIWQRILAASYGSILLHLSIIVIASGGAPIDSSLLVRINDLALFLGIIVLAIILSIYSLIFALIVVFSHPKGTLLRNFVYGVFLPATTYTISGYIVSIVRGG